MLRIAAYVWNLSLKTIQWKIPLLLFQLCSVKQKLVQGRVNFQVILWKYCLDFTVVRHIFVSITVNYIHYQISLLNPSFNHYVMCDYHHSLKGENCFCWLACLQYLRWFFDSLPKILLFFSLLFVDLLSGEVLLNELLKLVVAVYFSSINDCALPLQVFIFNP